MNAVEGQYAYCPGCGQKLAVGRLTLAELVHDVVHYFTHADTSVFSLVKNLAKQPGYVPKEYIRGKRKAYFKPLNFFLIVASIVAFSTAAFYKPQNGRSQKLYETATAIKQPAAKANLMVTAKRLEHVETFTGRYANVINMLALPLLSLIFWFAYRRQFNYIECVVANMYIVGFTMLVYALAVVPLKHFIPGLATYLLVAFFLFEVLYRGASFRVIDRNKNAWKAYGISAITSLSWVALNYVVISHYIQHGF